MRRYDITVKAQLKRAGIEIVKYGGKSHSRVSHEGVDVSQVNGYILIDARGMYTRKELLAAIDVDADVSVISAAKEECELVEAVEELIAAVPEMDTELAGNSVNAALNRVMVEKFNTAELSLETRKKLADLENQLKDIHAGLYEKSLVELREKLADLTKGRVVKVTEELAKQLGYDCRRYFLLEVKELVKRGWAVEIAPSEKQVNSNTTDAAYRFKIKYQYVPEKEIISECVELVPEIDDVIYPTEVDTLADVKAVVNAFITELTDTHRAIVNEWIDRIDIKINKRYTRCLGRAFGKWAANGDFEPVKIEIGAKFLRKEKFVSTKIDVIKHELLHLITNIQYNKSCGHNEQYKDNCAIYGVTGNTTREIHY